MNENLSVFVSRSKLTQRWKRTIQKYFYWVFSSSPTQQVIPIFARLSIKIMASFLSFDSEEYNAQCLGFISAKKVSVVREKLYRNFPLHSKFFLYKFTMVLLLYFDIKNKTTNADLCVIVDLVRKIYQTRQHLLWFTNIELKGV